MRKLDNSELDRKDVEAFKKAEKTPLIVILDDVRSLHNIGSVFRTSDAFLIEKIYLCGITAQPPHKEIHKTALGATDTVAWEYVENVIDVVHRLKEDKVKVVAVEQVAHSTSLEDFEVEKDTRYALVFGNEVKGVAQEVVDLVDSVIEIPQLGTKHSLNIAVSTGIVLWDLFKQMHYTKK